MAEETKTLSLLEQMQAEEERLKAEEAAQAEGRKEQEKEGTADIKQITRQSIYGKTVDEIDQMESNLREATARTLQRGARLEELPLGEMTLGEIAYPVTKEQATGEEEPFVSKEVDLKTLAETPKQIERVKQEQQDKYQAILNLDADEIQSEYEKLGNQYGWETAVDKDTGIKYFVPPPSFANNPLLVTGARFASETGRGIAQSLGIALEQLGAPEDVIKDVENIIPKIEDESQVVTVGSEVMSLLAGGAGVLKLFNYLTKNAPKATKWLGGVLGVATGEALVATEETGTVREAFGGEKIDDPLTKKLQVLTEGLLIGSAVSAGGRAINYVTQMSPVRALIESLPVLISGSKEPSERAVGQAIAETGARTERGRTGVGTGEVSLEELLDSVKKIRGDMRVKFKEQTGKDFDDVVEGRVEMDPEDFKTTLAGLIGPEEFGSFERAAVAGASEMTGRSQAQQEAIGRTEAQLGTRKEAIEAGKGAQAEIRASLDEQEELQKAAVTKPLQRQVDEAIDELDQMRVSDASLTPSGKRSKTATRLKANKFAEKATERVRAAFVNARNAKNKAYDAYLKRAEKVEIPVTEVQRTLLRAFGPDEIANIPAKLASTNPALLDTLEQILRQEQQLEQAIAAYRKGRNLKEGTATPPGVVKRIKKEINYQDSVKLSNVETLRDAVDFTASRAFRLGDENSVRATDMLKPEVDGLINKYLKNNEGLSALRNDANQIHQQFKDTFFAGIGDEVAESVRFGYKMTDTEMAAATAKFMPKLRGAIRGNIDDAKYVDNVRNQMPPETQARFDAEIEESLYNEVLNDLARVDMTSAAAKKDPVGTVGKLNAALESILTNEAFALLPKTVVQKLNARFGPIIKKADNVVDARTALEDASSEIRKIEQEIVNDPSYQFVSSSTKESNPLTIVTQILRKPSNSEVMEELWQRASTRGEVLESGLTKAQEDLQAVFAKGLLDFVKTGDNISVKNMKTAVKENPAFNLYFPPESSQRQSLDMMISQVEATQVHTGKLAGLTLEENLKDLSIFARRLITYVKGPLTEEGRRMNILKDLYFKMVGGQKQLESILLETVLDPRIADRILKETQERIQQQLIDADEAYLISVGKYVLGRSGIASLSDLEKDVKTFVIEEDTQEALPVSP